MSSNESQVIRHRSKLSHADVKIILHLIIQVKPFKYVGDRTLSQSRKWDLIQQKLEHHKLQQRVSALVVPTVRTLQRQMATALRKAQHRQRAENFQPFAVFHNLSLHSPMADLELAVLELYNLSEAYKRGQTVGPLPEALCQETDGEAGHEVDISLPELEMAEPRRYSSSASHNPSPGSHGSYDLDNQDGPEDLAHIHSLLRELVNQNRKFYSECIALIRHHTAAMDERCLQLEQLIMFSSRQRAPPPEAAQDPKIKLEPETLKHEDSGSVSAPVVPDKKDGMFKSILELLN